MHKKKNKKKKIKIIKYSRNTIDIVLKKKKKKKAIHIIQKLTFSCDYMLNFVLNDLFLLVLKTMSALL